MNQTFQNSAQVLSIGVFFTLMILGLATTLPHTMVSGAHRHTACRPPTAHRVAAAPAGIDPVRRLPRLQPDPAPPRQPRARDALDPQPSGAHRPLILPGPDLRTISQRTPRDIRVRDPGMPDRRRRVNAARQALALEQHQRGPTGRDHVTASTDGVRAAAHRGSPARRSGMGASQRASDKSAEQTGERWQRGS